MGQGIENGGNLTQVKARAQYSFSVLIAETPA